MINKSFVHLVKCRWREFCREPSAFFFVVFMPLVWMVVLGLAFSGSKKISKVGIPLELDGKLSAFRDQVITSLGKTSRFQLLFEKKSELQARLKRGDIVLIVELVKNKVLYNYDQNNMHSVNTKYLVDSVIQDSFGRINSVETQELITVEKGDRYIDFLVPGLLALSLLTTSLYGTGMVLVASRREKILKRYRMTPMSTIEYILSHAVGRYLIMIVEFFVVMTAGYLLFDFVVIGKLFDYLILCILGTGCFTSLALLCGSRISNASTYNGLANLVVMLMMLLSGVWFSKAVFPLWLSEFASFLPLGALVDGSRKIALEGISIYSLGFEILVLTLYLVCSLAVTHKIFKWY